MNSTSSTRDLRERKNVANKMNWNSSGQEESDNEMFQMSSSRMQEDGARVRLLSLSEDEAEPLRNGEREVPTLSFRRNLPLFSRKEEEKKFKLALISVLIIGITLIIIINVGLGIGLNTVSDRSPPVVNPCLKDEKDNKSVKHCEKSFPWHSYRLPEHIHPRQYFIFLHPNLTLKTYTGSVDILIHVARSTNKIILHSVDQALEDVKVYQGDATGEPSRGKEMQQKEAFSNCSNLDFIAIVLKDSLDANETYTVHIEFSGIFPPTSLRGFYLSNYKTASGENRTIATTQFESISARAAFPCFDEPSFKANFTLTMVHDPQHSVLSNMPIEKTTVIEGGLKQDRFQTSVVMSTYLVAFIVSDFVSINKTIALKNGKIPVAVHASKDKISKADFALNVACRILMSYERVFQIPYPLPKLDLVAIPDFEAGAMENWGLVTYRETAILYDNKTSSTRDKQWVAIVIAHELAHQWFGNLVTMKWWNDLWLNEGFASYVEFYGTDKIFPDWHIMSSFNNIATAPAMSTDESTYTHPITVKVESSVEIDELFDTISYQKGSCIISMLINYLGEELFFDGVADYLKKYAYQNTVNENLINAVSKRAKSMEKQENIKKMMKSWTTQSGFPVVSISRDGNKVTVSQSRYLLSIHDEDTHDCSKDKQEDLWQIPLSYVTDQSPNDPQWYYLDKRQASFAVTGDPEWIKFNFNTGGYYVINYSSEMLDTLIKQMKNSHKVFPAKDRAGILFDAMKAAKTGRLSYEKLFDLLTYLKDEDDYEPIYTVGLFLMEIEDKLKRQFDNPSHENIKLLAKKLLAHIYSKYGWDANENALSHSQKLMRKLVVGAMCKYQDKDCLDKAWNEFVSWKKGNYSVPLDFKSTVYCAGVRLGTSEDWDHVWNAYTTDLTLDATEKLKLLVGLTCTHDVHKMTFLLDEALKGKSIKSQDISRVFSYLTDERAGSYIAWKFVRSKLNEITQISPLGSFAMRSILQSIVSTFTDETDIAGAEQFFAANNLTEVRYVKRALDKVKIKVHWIKNYQPEVVRWLKDNVDSV